MNKQILKTQISLWWNILYMKLMQLIFTSVKVKILQLCFNKRWAQNLSALHYKCLFFFYIKSDAVPKFLERKCPSCRDKMMSLTEIPPSCRGAVWSTLLAMLMRGLRDRWRVVCLQFYTLSHKLPVTNACSQPSRQSQTHDPTYPTERRLRSEISRIVSSSPK